MSKLRIAIIGAGVVGLSIARSLALRGAKVTLFERDWVGAGTSSTTYAWVNSNGKSPLSYHQLNVEGMEEHRRLQAQCPTQGRWLDECGTYEWASGSDHTARLKARVEALQAKGYPAIAAKHEDIAALLPELLLPSPTEDIWSFPSESLLCPSIFLGFLCSEARKLGVVLEQRQEVTGIDEHDHAITLHLGSNKRWEGDLAVSAVGRWTQRLASFLGKSIAMINADQPDKIGCGFLGYTSPLRVQLRSNLITPEINIRPEGGGRLLLQVPDLDHLANPAYRTPPDAMVGREMLHRLRRVLRHTADARLERIEVGQRARPADGRPVVGFLTDRKKLYAVVTHSGMTLAPVLGNLVAAELVLGERSPLLAEYGPERLLGKRVEDFQAIETIHYPASQ